MLKSSIEFAPQGGKTDMARGGRKQIYQRRVKPLTPAMLEAIEAGYIDQSGGYAS